MLRVTNEEKMDRVFGYIKENVPSAIKVFYGAIELVHRDLELNVNRCAINQRNWRMYRVNLGGNGRHRNIRKAIRLMANSKRPRINVVISDISSIDDIDVEINERDRTPILKWLMQMPMSDKGPERGISKDLNCLKDHKI